MEDKQTMEQKREIWQRVNPTLQPYPIQQSGAPADAQELNVCCMGTSAQQDVDVVRGFIEEELADRRGYQVYAAAAPSQSGRQLLRQLAMEEGGHARKLMGVYYLITGQVYCPAVQTGRIRIPPWRELLRLRYHEEACGGLNYRRAAEGTDDECLQEIFNSLSRDEYRHARQLLSLLEKQISI